MLIICFGNSQDIHACQVCGLPVVNIALVYLACGVPKQAQHDVNFYFRCDCNRFFRYCFK